MNQILYFVYIENHNNKPVYMVNLIKKQIHYSDVNPHEWRCLDVNNFDSHLSQLKNYSFYKQITEEEVFLILL